MTDPETSVFKAYDIRGVFGRPEFDAGTVYRIGRWLPAVVHARRVLVGRDARLSSPTVRDALCAGLAESGCDVDDMGLATTPMVYFFTARNGYDLSVQVTASHNPPEHNGLKVSRRGALPVGYATGLQDLERLVYGDTLPPAAATPGRVRSVSLRDAFLEFLAPWRPEPGVLRVVVDCSDGMAGLVAHELFGPEATYLFDRPDGRFPHHAPNPLEPANADALARAVRERGADVGVLFDGDADRVVFVDETGRWRRPDQLIPLIAGHFLRKTPQAMVLHDIRTSRAVIEDLHAAGARTWMWKVGHAHAKLMLREVNAVCGGELAGHYYFRDFHHCDSGELAALIVLQELALRKRGGETLSSVLAPLDRYANSGELNYRVSDRPAAQEAVRRAAVSGETPVALWDFDGYRIEFADGWVSVRVSNTEPYLRLIIEAAGEERLAGLRARLEAALAPFLLPKPPAAAADGAGVSATRAPA